MIQVILLSTVVPAVAFGLILALAFWTPLAKQSPVVARVLVSLVAALAFAGGEVVLSGWPANSWLSAIPFLVVLAVSACLLEAVTLHMRLLQILGAIVVVGFALWGVTTQQRANGAMEDPQWAVSVLLTGFLALLPLASLILRGTRELQGARLGWIVTLIALSVSVALAGSALLGQLCGILVGLMSAYFFFACLSKTARASQAGHFVLASLGVGLLVVTHFVVDLPARALIALGLALTLAPWLQSFHRRGWWPLMFAVVVFLGLNGAALVWALNS